MDNDIIAQELYFLIFKYLDNGPCKNAAKAIKEEIEKHNLLPKRIDWLGNEHPLDFETFDSRNTHINDDYLLNIVSRTISLLNQQIPSSIHSVNTLLGSGSQSLLRTSSDINHFNESHFLYSRHHNAPLKPSSNKIHHYSQNIVNLFNSRQACGPSPLTSLLPTHMYERFIRFKRLLGHLASVYCVLFDRTGRFIFTGADDMLIKIWSAKDSRLLATLRGHSAVITDITVNYENTLLAAGSCDKMIRVWCIKTTKPICVLSGHTSQITSLKFCPLSKGNQRYLVSTSNDGQVCFWKWNAQTGLFNPKPYSDSARRQNKNAQVICSSFSPGGSFLAIGSSDHYIRVYHLYNDHDKEPSKVLEMEPHIDQVDSLQFSNCSLRFVTGSKDGTANIWKYERSEWHNKKLNMSETLPHLELNRNNQDSNTINVKLKVTMVGWSLDDKYVITAVNDHSIKIWESNSGRLKYVLKEHDDEVFVIETHPVDPRIFLSGGHDGKIFLWDLDTGKHIKMFYNQITGQGYGPIFDCKWSPDGSMFACTDSHGQLSIFGCGNDSKYKIVPDEVFFHTDYRPLVRDANHYVIDEQTQLAPHLMPPPFLVDIDGNPYPPHLQRLVPGREHCKEDQLVPYIAIQNERGVAEVLDPSDNHQPPPQNNLNNSFVNDLNLDNEQQRPTIDDMIERFQQEQANRRVNEEHGYAASGSNDLSFSNNNQQRLLPAAEVSFSNNSSNRPGVRRSGDIEGVRQSVGNWQSRGGNINQLKGQRTYVSALPCDELSCIYRKSNKFNEFEEDYYSAESKKKPIPTATTLKELSNKERLTRKKKQIAIQRRGIRETNRSSMSSRMNLNNTNNEDGELSIQSDDSDDTSFSLNGAESWGSSSSSSENSDSDDDWQFSRTDPRSNRTKRKQRTNRATIDSDDDQQTNQPSRSSGGRTLRELNNNNQNNYDDEQPSTSSGVSRKLIGIKSTRRITKAIKEEQQHLNEQEPFKFSEWLTELTPKRSPYFPQLDDELIYLKKGHQLYVDTVRSHNLYNVSPKFQPATNKKVKNQQPVKVREIDYEKQINPDRKINITIAILKVEILDDKTMKSNGNFLTIKYHDMPNVIDFLILKQFYDNSIQREWKPNDRFRSIIDNRWWFGTILEIVSDHNGNNSKIKNNDNENNDQVMEEDDIEDYSDNKDDDSDLFQKIKIIWEDGKAEDFLSKWDLEPICYDLNESNLNEPSSSSSFNESNRLGLSISQEDILRLMYQPKSSDWSDRDHNLECERLIKGLGEIMQTAWAEYFNAPVDLNEYPDYASIIAYPIDLTTIKTRLENKFYRSLKAVHFDFSYIVKNARVYNETYSMVNKNAKILACLCTRFIERQDLDDPTPILQEIQQNKELFEEVTESEAEEDKRNTRGRPKKNSNEPSWIRESKNLLTELFHNVDSEPFRTPVDLNEYEDYLEKVSTPMDLSTIKEQLMSGIYREPKEINRDFRFIFNNSKAYNTDKRSKIFAMTLRLESLVKDRMKSIYSTYKEEQLELQNKKSIKKSIKNSIKKSKLSNGASSTSQTVGTRKSERNLDQPSTSSRTSYSSSSLINNYTNGLDYQIPNRNSRRRSQLKTIEEQDDDQMSVETEISSGKEEVENFSDDDYRPKTNNRKVAFNKTNSEQLRRTGRIRKAVKRSDSETDDEVNRFDVSIDENTELDEEEQSDEQTEQSEEEVSDLTEEEDSSFNNKRKSNSRQFNGRKSLKRKKTRKGRKSKRMKINNGYNRGRKASLTTESEHNNSMSATDESATDVETINNSGSSSAATIKRGRRRSGSTNQQTNNNRKSNNDRYSSGRRARRKIDYRELDNGSDFECEESEIVNKVSSKGRIIKSKK